MLHLLFFFLDIFSDKDLEYYLNSNLAPESMTALGNVNPIIESQYGISIKQPLMFAYNFYSFHKKRRIIMFDEISFFVIKFDSLITL